MSSSSSRTRIRALRRRRARAQSRGAKRSQSRCAASLRTCGSDARQPARAIASEPPDPTTRRRGPPAADRLSWAAGPGRHRFGRPDLRRSSSPPGPLDTPPSRNHAPVLAWIRGWTRRARRPCMAVGATCVRVIGPVMITAVRPGPYKNPWQFTTQRSYDGAGSRPSIPPSSRGAGRRVPNSRFRIQHGITCFKLSIANFGISDRPRAGRSLLDAQEPPAVDPEAGAGDEVRPFEQVEDQPVDVGRRAEPAQRRLGEHRLLVVLARGPGAGRSSPAGSWRRGCAGPAPWPGPGSSSSGRPWRPDRADNPCRDARSPSRRC